VVGASCGVGTAALVIGLFAGARVLALVGAADQVPKAQALGTIPINRAEHPKFQPTGASVDRCGRPYRCGPSRCSNVAGIDPQPPAGRVPGDLRGEQRGTPRRRHL
jgi:hypothetical protein